MSMPWQEERPDPLEDELLSESEVDDLEELSLDDDGPLVEELDQDPAYDPDEPGLKDLKGG